MIIALKILGLAGLALIAAAPGLYFFDVISRGVMLALLLAGTGAWFAAAIPRSLRGSVR